MNAEFNRYEDASCRNSLSAVSIPNRRGPMLGAVFDSRAGFRADAANDGHQYIQWPNGRCRSCWNSDKMMTFQKIYLSIYVDYS